jgi:hypothetical protein
MCNGELQLNLDDSSKASGYLVLEKQAKRYGRRALYIFVTMFVLAIVTVFLEVPVLLFTYHWPAWAQFLPLVAPVLAILLLLALSVRYSQRASNLRSGLMHMLRPSLSTGNCELLIGSEERHQVVIRRSRWAGNLSAFVEGLQVAKGKSIRWTAGDVLEFSLGNRERHVVRVVGPFTQLIPVYELFVDGQPHSTEECGTESGAQAR